jgi:hypothetical protein
VVYVLVFLLAAAAGAAVSVATLRAGRVPQPSPASWTQRYESPRVEEDVAAATDPSAGPESVGRRALPSDPTWRTRFAGIAGLIIVCFVAAGAIVGALYAAYLALRGVFGG